ncbi:hypothetical protein JCGZ_14334 [Jatropha curcas]|uniref:RING-type domain-containing protein n=1 Tax=Jatropha curcas TaxID=180498 RepID=A0A067K0G2_JATCU|nr:uncharacterized protein LOC105642928 [Jatropha curcas]KDP28563.1 hypothetical protein JCGZ_14334 [Jatropha curcas]
MVINGNFFAKTICSICYEDLKPSLEDLQAISICGHVFHELCLQQWFEYCSKSNKCSCPVCKQSCMGNNVARLYFQSVEDQNEPSVSQKVIDCEDDPELLRGEVRRLAVKVSGLTTNLECQRKEIKQLNEELFLCKDQLKKEIILRNDVMEQKTSIQRLLLSKSEELDTQKLQCLRLQDRNMALAKELAALKLVSDLNLEEDEISKLASFGNEANCKDTIDVLRKSLIIRNKSYKQLMAKCNQLGRGEARSGQKLERAKEKIAKLKTKVQELEMIVEVKDNEALRALKDSKKGHCKEVNANDTTAGPNAFYLSYFSSVDQKEKHFKSEVKLDQTKNSNSDLGNFDILNDLGSNSTKEWAAIVALNKERDTCFLIDEAAPEFPTVHVLSDTNSKHSTSEDVKSTLPKSEAVSSINSKAKVSGLTYQNGMFGLRACSNSDKGDPLAATDEEVTLLHDDEKHFQSMLNIKKESPSLNSLSKPGDMCFSSGLLGPDGTNRYLGKWCKRGQSKRSVTLEGASTGSGDLIAVGSDGRGGRIKVLRSLNQSLLDSKQNSAAAKRCKYGAKASNLQIEHFFSKTTH